MQPTWVSDCGTVRIYSLADPRDGSIRYVGKTVRSLERRVIEHCWDSSHRGGQTHRKAWIQKLKSLGLKPIPALLEVVPPEGDWAAVESKWITHFRNAGCRLVNATDGGEGLSGYVPTEAHRLALSLALTKGRSLVCEVCGTMFHRKPRDIQNGDCRCCSRACYAVWQTGRKKNVRFSTCGQSGREAAAKKRRGRTHCQRGHLLSGENLYVNTSGSRVCKECRKIHKKAHLSRKAAR